MKLKRPASLTLIGALAAMGCSETPAADSDSGAVAVMADDVTAMTAASVGYDGIPRNAMRVSSGKGILRLRVGRDGTVWVGDDDVERQLLKETVKRHDLVEVDPYANEVSINGRVVSTRILTKGRRHSIFHLDARQQPKWD